MLKITHKYGIYTRCQYIILSKTGFGFPYSMPPINREKERKSNFKKNESLKYCIIYQLSPRIKYNYHEGEIMKVIFMEEFQCRIKRQIKDCGLTVTARNYLLPHKLAMPARAGDIKNVEAQIKSEERALRPNRGGDESTRVSELENKEIIIKAKWGHRTAALRQHHLGLILPPCLESSLKAIVRKRKKSWQSRLERLAATKCRLN